MSGAESWVWVSWGGGTVDGRVEGAHEIGQPRVLLTERHCREDGVALDEDEGTGAGLYGGKGDPVCFGLCGRLETGMSS